MISSENAASEAQFENFHSMVIHLPFLRYSIFHISSHSINFKIFDVMMSITTRDRIDYWTYLLNHKSIGNKIWPTNRNSLKQFFKWYFEWFRGLNPSSRPFLIYQLTENNPKPITKSHKFFHSFEVVEISATKK